MAQHPHKATSFDDELPEKTIAILLGASQFNDRQYDSNTAFSISKTMFKYYVSKALNSHPETDCLDLFDDGTGPDAQDIKIVDFIKSSIDRYQESTPPLTSLIVYYVGHGAFEKADYYLALKSTRKSNPLVSGLQFKALATTIEREANWLRTFIILDACFSGEAARHMASIGDAVKQQVEHAFLKMTVGVTLFCSSSRDSVSFILPDNSATAFTESLQYVLLNGAKIAKERLSLWDVEDLTWRQMQEKSRILAGRGVGIDYRPVKPEIHSPMQPTGNLAQLDFFPNRGKIAVAGISAKVQSDQIIKQAENNSPSSEAYSTHLIYDLHCQSVAKADYFSKLASRLKKKNNRIEILLVVSIAFSIIFSLVGRFLFNMPSVYLSEIIHAVPALISGVIMAVRGYLRINDQLQLHQSQQSRYKSLEINVDELKMDIEFEGLFGRHLYQRYRRLDRSLFRIAADDPPKHDSLLWSQCYESAKAKSPEDTFFSPHSK